MYSYSLPTEALFLCFNKYVSLENEMWQQYKMPVQMKSIKNSIQINTGVDVFETVRKGEKVNSKYIIMQEGEYIEGMCDEDHDSLTDKGKDKCIQYRESGSRYMGVERSKQGVWPLAVGYILLSTTSVRVIDATTIRQNWPTSLSGR